jgi:hypothetical protein
MVFRALAIITLVSNVGALLLNDQQKQMRPEKQSLIETNDLIGYDSEEDYSAHPTASPFEIGIYKTFMDPKPPISDTHPEIKKGTGVPLKSGDKFVLESEVEPGVFITTRPLGKVGSPLTQDLAHITGGQLHLKSGISAESTFSFENADSSGIKSGEKVKWIQGEERIDLDMKSNWPNTPKKNKRPNAAPDFLVEHARDVDRKWIEYNFGDAPQRQFWQMLLKDSRKGEAIKDGDSVWIRHHAVPGDTHGEWLFMTGDPAEGYHVAFPHHYPLFDGHVKNYETKSWFNWNDPHSTSSRFTVRKV